MFVIANILDAPAWILILLLIALLFGVKRLPELGKGLAEGIVEFKKASRKLQEEDTPAKPESKEES